MPQTPGHLKFPRPVFRHFLHSLPSFANISCMDSIGPLRMPTKAISIDSRYSNAVEFDVKHRDRTLARLDAAEEQPSRVTRLQ